MNNTEPFIAYFKLIHQDLNKLEFKLESKNRIYFPLLSSAIDHCIAINFLNKEFMTASMYALIRPALESYLRAMWVKHCCGDIPMDTDLTKMHIPKKVEVLMKEVDEEVPEFKINNYLQTTLGALVPNLHDFTHGGIQSIARQYSEDTLTNIRNEQEIKSILKLSVLISSLAYGEIIQDNVGSEALQADIIGNSAVHLIQEL
ncbi:hypothetical protein LL295_23930 [Vibrio campbellii]|uniref:DUF6988 family protein n=1 Tax=Vibrio campbellii TaxID=680 RepID=UPI001D17A301|nr:hypothetical protein [Vibrio campbellii]MCC4226524.1 hypothetical protein [Vibrio campbellii]